jgi:hypothetical protein
MKEAVDLLDTFLTARIEEPKEPLITSEAVAVLEIESVATGAQ